MQLDDVSSKKLTLIRFPLIVGVIYIHAYSSTVNMAHGTLGVCLDNAVYDFIRNIISQGLARVVVPLFYLISGFLFFNQFVATKANYIQKYKNRFHTLIVPYVFWNILILFLCYLGQSISITLKYFSGKNELVINYTLYEYINSIFGITREYPISYQFWFIRVLILLVISAPLIYWLIKKTKYALLVIITILWLFGPYNLYVMPTLFFYGGSYLAMHSISLFRLDNKGIKMVFLYLVILVVGNTLGNSPIQKVGILFGIPAMLYMSRYLYYNNHIEAIFTKLSKSSFFIFCFHEPLLTIIKKLIYNFMKPNNSLEIFILYLIIPVIVIAISLMVYIILKIYFPLFTKLITGGRT